MPLLLAFLALAAEGGPATGATAAEAAQPWPPAGCHAVDVSLAGVRSEAQDEARLAELQARAPSWPRLLQRASGERPLLLCDALPMREEAGDPPRPGALAWELLPVSSFSKLHTGWSDDRNDGALFAGRGLSTQLSAGVRARWRWFTAQAAPLAAWQENRAFALPQRSVPGRSPYANPFEGLNGFDIDLPLRMGPSSFWTLDPGQSWVRADVWNFALGFSTENLWWGPGLRNAILMSNSAPGFPHVFLGTSRPHDVWAGWLEVELVWGWPRESRWFDADPANDRRLFTSFALTFEPAFARGLYLGAARVFVNTVPPGGLPAGRYLDPVLQPIFKIRLQTASNRRGDSPDNQLLSLFFRWAVPAGGIEAYGEWARDDHSWNGNDLVQELGHSQAWLLGLQKVARVGGRGVRVVAELAHTFETPAKNPTRATPEFYTHHAVRQGYTNRGQMIGAGIGPQADSQFLAVDVEVGDGRVGGYLERVLRNERYYHDEVVPTLQGVAAWNRHDVELVASLRGLWSSGAWDVEWEAGWGHRWHANFQKSGDDLKGQLRVSWWPGRNGSMRSLSHEPNALQRSSTTIAPLRD